MTSSTSAIAPATSTHQWHHLTAHAPRPIQANPFFETTDGCLFSWARDLDQVLGLDEATRLEGRITTAPKKGASSLIYEDWRRLMEGEDLVIPGPDLNANHRVGGGGKA